MLRTVNNHGDFFRVPKDLMITLFNLVGRDVDGWKNLMSLLMVNNTFYQMYFKDMQVAKHLEVSIHFPNLPTQNRLYSFASMRHILRVNHMQSSIKYKQISDVMDKYNIPSQSPGTVSNLPAITAAKSQRGNAIQAHRNDMDVLKTTRLGLGVILVMMGAVLPRILHEHGYISPIGIFFMFTLALMTGKFGYDDYQVKTEGNLRTLDDYEKQMQDLNTGIEFIQSKQRKLLGKASFFGRQDVVSIPHITSEAIFNRMLRVNNVLSDPDFLTNERAAAQEAGTAANVDVANDQNGNGGGLLLFLGALAMVGAVAYATTRNAPANQRFDDHDALDDQDSQDDVDEPYDYRARRYY